MALAPNDVKSACACVVDEPAVALAVITLTIPSVFCILVMIEVPAASVS